MRISFLAATLAYRSACLLVLLLAAIQANAQTPLPPTLHKSFLLVPPAPPLYPGLTAHLSFDISNPNVPLEGMPTFGNLTGVGFTDTLPTGLVVATPNNLHFSCGGATITAVAGSGSVSLAGLSLPSTAPPCNITVDVLANGAATGLLTNTTGAPTSNEGGSGTPASATVTVTPLPPVNPPTLHKSFFPISPAPPLYPGLTAHLSFDISNPNTPLAGLPTFGNLTGVGFTDTLPTGLVVATPNNLHYSCAGTITAVAGSGSVSVAGLSIPVGAPPCNIIVDVLANGAATGLLTNTTGAPTSNEGGSGTPASATVTVTPLPPVNPPTLHKSFFPVSPAPPLYPGLTAHLSFDISNPNTPLAGLPTFGNLTGVGFTDTLPTGLVVATPNNLHYSCAGTITAVAGSGSVSVAGLSIPVGAPPCNIIVDVLANGAATGLLTNTTGAPTSNEGGSGTPASATVTVASAILFTKSFAAPIVLQHQTVGLTFKITNNITTPLTNVSFTDPLPAGLLVATPNGLTGSCGGGTITATAGSASIQLSGATLAVGASCTFSVNILGDTGGVKTNTTSIIMSDLNQNGGQATDTVTVVAPPSISKQFGSPTIPLNGNTTLSFTITNPNAIALTGVGFTDDLPAGLVVATPNGLTSTCGTATAMAGSSTISLVGGTVAINSSCTVSLNVTGTTAGTKNNTSSNVTSAEAGTGNTASDTLTVLAPPVITKAFSDSQIELFFGFTTLTFTVSNPAANPLPLTGVGFVDHLPAGLIVLAPDNGVTGSCFGGTITAVPASSGISLAGATLPQNGSCTFSVLVNGVQIGVWTNTTDPVTSGNGGTGLPTTAAISVQATEFLRFFSDGGAGQH